MKLSLIYHFSSNIETLDKSLNSILNQTNQDFEFILIDDCSDIKAKEIVGKKDFKKNEKFKYINSNEKLSHSYSFNLGLKDVNGEYIYYLGSNVILEKNFVENFTKLIEKYKSPDMVIFNSSKNTFVSTNFDESLVSNMQPSIKDKIFNVSFLKKNEIEFENFQYYPLLYLCKCLHKTKNILITNEKFANFLINKNYSYNLYDIFDQNVILLAKKNNFSFLNSPKNIELFEFMIIYSTIYVFLKKFYNAHKKYPKRIGRALHSSNEWLIKNIPNWRENIYIKNNILGLNDKIFKFLSNFRFKLIYIYRNSIE